METRISKRGGPQLFAEWRCSGEHLLPSLPEGPSLGFLPHFACDVFGLLQLMGQKHVACNTSCNHATCLFCLASGEAKE